nr:helix-turn-helix transcriptional regulator [uncultured Rhodoferax sp.]
MENDSLSVEQCRAGRSYLGWTQQQLAEAANVAASTIADFERGQRTPVANNVRAIRVALESHGIAFINGGVSYALSWTFKTEKRTGVFQATFHPESAVAVLEFAAIFGTVEPGKVAIKNPQRATPELKSALTDYVAKFGKVNPRLKAIASLLGGLSDDEYFLVLPASDFSTEEQLQQELVLQKLNNPELQTFESEHQEFFGALLKEYNTHVPNTVESGAIGHPVKADRVCRFCGGTKAKGARFDRVAHAVSASLGSHLKLHDECDVCNSYFGEKIEPTLLEVLNVARVFLGLTNRGKRPKVSLPGGTLSNDGELMIIESTALSSEESGALVANLGSGKPLRPQDVYRTLVKFALSVIPEVHLPDFAKTINWLRNNEHQDEPLPMVAAALVLLPPSPAASIVLHVRKSAASRLPHVLCEFRVGPYLYVYALPFSQRDSWDLVGFFDTPDFRKTFRHLAAVPSWSLQDYSSPHEIPLATRIRFEQRAGQVAATG